MRRSSRVRGKLANPEPYNSASFFMIYFEKFHTQKMPIPPPYELFKGEVPKKVFLESSLGKNGVIELEESDNILFLQKKGWEKFVTDNSLKDGQFLVFRYKGDAAFTVGVFGVDGSRKDKEVPIRRQPPMTLHPEAAETVVEGPCTELKDLRFVKVASKKTHLMLIPRHVFDVYGVVPPERNFPEQVIVSKEGGFSGEVTLFHWPDRVVLGRGWSEFRKRNGIKDGHEIEFEMTLNDCNKIQELKLVRHSSHSTLLRNL